MNRASLITTVLVLMVVVACVGCGNPDPNKGYTTTSQYRTDVRTIAVPIFRRGTYEYRRDIEFRLTKALIRHIEAETHYKVVDKSRADTLLTGVIQSVEQDVLSFNPRTGLAREIQMRVTVDFTWKDLRPPGEIIREEKGFSVSADYIPSAPFNEDFFLGSEDAFDKMARRIVEKLRRRW